MRDCGMCCPPKIRRECETPVTDSGQKSKGEPVRTAVKQRDTGNVVNLMGALRKS